MLLTVDVGNSQTVLATFDGDRRVDCWRVTTHARATADELHMLWRGLLRDTADRAEGRAAFVARRTPSYQGR